MKEERPAEGAPVRAAGRAGGCRSAIATLSALLIPLALVAQAALAQPGTYESEPNDRPAEADPISGEATVFGTMAGTDQDGFLWTVSDEDAGKRWTFELEGIPGALTVAEVVRLELADNGVDVTGYEKLLKMGTRDGSTPAVARDLIFEPGEYLIGLAHAGGSPPEGDTEGAGGGMFRPPATDLSFGDDGTPDVTTDTGDTAAESRAAYRFVIREGSKLNVVAQYKRGAERSDPQAVRPGGEGAPFETRPEAWYSLDFDAEDADRRWDVRVQVPVARVVDATLLDAEGNELDEKRSDERGRLEFPGIAPREEPYLVKVELHDPGFVTAIGSEAVGRRVEGEEAEPNGKWDLANRVDLSRPLTARVDETNETDYFRFSLDEAATDRLLSLRLESEPEAQKVLFCLHDGDGDRLQCRDTETPVELPDLLLAPGEWGLSVSRTKAEFSYTVSLTEQGPVEAGREVEPNDSIETASTVPANNRIKGRASGEENDFFRFLVADEPQLWRFQVIGDGLKEIAYYDGAGKRVAKWRPRAGQRRLRLDNLFLLPGKHYIRVEGADGAEYTLLARPLGPPDPNGEREPNDDTSRMQRLAIGQTRSGLLSDENDQDYYRFFLANWDHIRLTVEPPPDGVVSPDIYWYGHSLFEGIPPGTGKTMSIAGVFPPGDYHLQLSTREPSDAEYRVSLERLPRYSCGSDCEPNGRRTDFAASLPPDLVLEGRSGDWRDTDIYSLPERAEPNRLVIRSAERTGRIWLRVRDGDTETLRYDDETGTYSTTVPPGGPHHLVVRSDGEPYRLRLEFERGPEPLADRRLAATLELELAHDAVSAFRVHGQRVTGELRVGNTGSVPVRGRLEATTSDYRWRVSLDKTELVVPAGGTVGVPVEVLVPPDAWADRPVRISARLFDGAGRQSETWTEVAVDRELPPVEPRWNWPIPDALRGGFNAAWLPFGGRLAGEIPRRADDPQLRDGLVFEGRRVSCCGDSYEEGTRPAITLELPGDEPMPVAGVAIDLFGTTGPFENLRRATLLLSSDGRSFEEALHFEALPVRTEQYFALDEPVAARFARLRIEATYQEPGSGGVTLGEWKVIVAPGYDLSDGRGFNLADPELGGHLVWDWPPRPYSPTSILDAEKVPNPVRAKAGTDIEYVIGFHEDRAAQIERVEWVNKEKVEPQYAFEEVAVSISRESPMGPWQRVGSLDPGSRPGPTVLELDTAVWARFVKLTGVRQGDSGIAAAPKQIRIWERPTGDDYRSVLTEWGYGNRRAFYEEQIGIPAQPELEAADNLSRDTAASLAAGEAVTEQVALARRSHWYRLRMPADANTLEISMSGSPTVRTVLELEDEAGAPIPLRRRRRESTPGEHRFEAIAEPGSTLYLHVSEPPRNVVFSWDTSASVNAHLPTIYNALAAFTDQVVPGRESVNFVPFGRGALLDTWLGEPYMLQTILNDYPRRESSSSGEKALQTSAQLLADVPGTKAIVLISDGAVTHHGAMWKEMREVQPRIFGVGVAGYEAAHRDVFQDWASVNGGYFAPIRYLGEMEVAFDRAATLMRRPADYALEVTTEFREAPGPGTLRVVADGNGDGGTALGGAAVELILDASGSMLKRMGGKRRIVIAKEVLDETVQEHLPPATPVALRVFGHQEPGTCATELVMPLGPLDPDRAAAAIDAIQAKNLARTPIADSLAAVSRDLRDAKSAAVVLVTDGEETCDGDPAAAIESLSEKGIDVSVNIVGFAIDDETLEHQFAEWAELGGGRYFSAADERGLSEALEQALQLPYDVFDASGERVARGLLGGEPVELEQGYYRVVVGTSPPRTFEDVEIVGEQEVRLEVPGLR